jgi:hypothetical protein
VQAIDLFGILFIVFSIDEKEGREVVLEFVEDGGGSLGEYAPAAISQPIITLGRWIHCRFESVSGCKRGANAKCKDLTTALL